MEIPHAPLPERPLWVFLTSMADTTGPPTGNSTHTEAPSGIDNAAPRRSSWKYIGPGIVVAATGVGAA